MTPIIKFRLNKDLDKQTCLNFLDLKCAGIDFGKGIISTHPELKSVRLLRPVARKGEISRYIDHFYEKYEVELAKTLYFLAKDWKQVEKSFFKQAKKVFCNFPWPKGKYICYLSVFNCNPRFLHDKTFQIFYKNEKDWKIIISHELLHFIFYNYLNVKSGKKLSDAKKWILSEIFNAVILNQDIFKKLISPSKEFGYPEHKKFIKTLTKEWKKHKNIDRWLKIATKTINGI